MIVHNSVGRGKTRQLLCEWKKKILGDRICGSPWANLVTEKCDPAGASEGLRLMPILAVVIWIQAAIRTPYSSILFRYLRRE